MFENNKQPLSISKFQDSNDRATILFSLPKAAPVSHWDNHESEGQLAVDVVNSGEDLLIIATMAGAKPDDVELHLHNDFLTIRGRRQSPAPTESEHFYQECFWGNFSRTIVLPVDVKSELARAEFRNGLLLIYLPKKQYGSTIPIMIVDE